MDIFELAMMKKLGGGNGGSAVQPDLSQNDPNAADYVKNRTHYEAEEIVNEPLNLTWDGNTEGLVSPADKIYKVSDLVLTDEQIKSATLTLSNGTTNDLSVGWDVGVSNGLITEDLVDRNFAIFVRKPGVTTINGTVYPEAGIYAYKPSSTFYFTSITTTEPIEQTKTVVHKLDKKFLPDGIATKADIFGAMEASY